ncbi:hypothetical protein pipiens_017757 [Culex pipiens pipiens]|uniref:Uncharacterized protein n=1 Tax=Culex pipiens pipiens TaxID=38569 RepID=A0ABD1CF28_CULPP
MGQEIVLSTEKSTASTNPSEGTFSGLEILTRILSKQQKLLLVLLFCPINRQSRRNCSCRIRRVTPSCLSC